MTTILDTLGIAQCTVTYGREASFAGRAASVAVRITPMALGVGQLRLVWTATGDVLTSFDDTTATDSTAPGTIVLPQTGQTGFRHGTTTFKDWYYRAVVTSSLPDGQYQTRTYNFQIPAGMAALDLDTLDEDSQMVAVPATGPTTSTTGVSLWTAMTAYTAGQIVIWPDGSIQQAKATHTSGAGAPNPANWTPLNTTSASDAATYAAKPIALTQTAYDTLTVKNPATLYLIVDQ